MPQRFSTLAQTSAVGVFEADERGQWNMVNDAGRRLLGLASGFAWYDCVARCDQTQVLEAWLLGVAGVEGIQLEFETMNGHLVGIQAAPVKGGGWVGTMLDLKPRVAEVEARELSILSTLPDMVFMLSADDDYLFYRGPVDKRLLRPPEDWLGTNLRDALPPDMQERFLGAKRRSRATGEVQVVEYDLETPAGIGHFEARIRSLPDGTWIAVVRDFTETKHTQDALVHALATAEAASSIRAQFLANVGHELRTPLNGVLGMSEILRRTGLSAEQREYVDVLQTSGRALLELIDEILEIARLESGAVEFDLEGTHVAGTLEIIFKAYRALAQADGLRFELDEISGWVRADPARLKQVVAAILHNAVKFTERGEIRVGAREDGDWVVISVSDTGPGIPEAYRDSIFAPFTQGDASSTRRFGGVGLGLAIAHQLTRRMGGSIEFDSELGSGTTFRVRLPRTEPETADDPIPRGEVGLRTLRVLMVEDNPANAVVLQLMLEADKHHVYRANSGAEAVALLREVAVDVALLDLHMPEMDGFETCEALWLLHPTLPVVAVTADTQPEVERRCLEVGMISMVRKPYHIDELRAAMALAVS